PPVGMNLFVLQGISPNSKMTEIVRGAIPFALVMAFEILLLCFFPGIATWLPGVLK
ncbi:MAG: TRAP transporter large permease subunit, partial [Acholeplasmataceae bacterium]|nr:TRAP transporter large permease subunit [Acholeplasmataceae bacterium]